ETALFRVPQVVVYKTGNFTYRLGRLFVSFKFFSLVNLILDRALVREVLQFNLSENIRAELKDILENKQHYEEILKGYDELIAKVGEPGSSERVASRMLALCD
ncbi:MAG TPA: hypothetical protein VJ951_09870, partial [Bacteroidales bacterium]|nr:hypothetical protein [Bacteroidales bacterium]